MTAHDFLGPADMASSDHVRGSGGSAFRPSEHGKGAGPALGEELGPAPTPQALAKLLHLHTLSPTPTWDEVLEAASSRYWERRPNIRPDCGSDPGYQAHMWRKEATCAPCREAHRLVAAIRRLRVARGLPAGGVRPVMPDTQTSPETVRMNASGSNVSGESGQPLLPRKRAALLLREQEKGQKLTSSAPTPRRATP